MRKVLVESLLLAVIGGILGIGVAYAGTRLMLRLAFQTGGPNNYVPIEAAPSWPILLFTLVVSVLTGVLFGIAPAWMTSHTDPADALRGAGRSIGAGRSSWAQKSAGDRPDRGVDRIAVRGGPAGPESAQPGAPEFRVRNAGPVYRLDQSHAGQLQTGANGAAVSADRR